MGAVTEYEINLKIQAACFEHEDAVGPLQTPISLSWRHKNAWPAIRQEWGLSETGAAIAIYSQIAYRHGLSISYSRRKQHYANIPDRYKNPLYTYRSVTRAVDHLAELGLIIHDKRNPGDLGWRSAFQPTHEFVQRTEELCAGEKPHPVAPSDPIILRDGDGNAVDYRDNRDLDRARSQIDGLNQELKRHDVCDENGSVVAAPIARIFNQSFARGGRAYALGASWQSMPGEDRREMRIDGEPVIEVDYKALHPTLLYAKAGLEPPADPYDIPGWTDEDRDLIPRSYRGLVKLGMLIVINAKNKQSALSAIAKNEEMASLTSRQLMKKIGALIASSGVDADTLIAKTAHELNCREEPVWAVLNGGNHCPPNELLHEIARQLGVAAADLIECSKADVREAFSIANELIEAIKKTHDRIRGYFHSDAGSWLMNVDSRMAMHVMRRFAKSNDLALPVHDSFIVRASKVGQLEEAMFEAAHKAGIERVGLEEKRGRAATRVDPDTRPPHSYKSAIN
ncbi:hypothetical protein [Rhodovibrio salinarum]|uniref:Uncharacterized protein n=1 Tax=Rhodovibrio salinarum TaxID=1087 RepID=A0A934QED3_9PROT|nr:hypothetical protein [Rhodovibrio salinarum]MBK1695646.1 hypothetical protein [Rhodovibrio salinarum]